MFKYVCLLLKTVILTEPPLRRNQSIEVSDLFMYIQKTKKILINFADFSIFLRALTITEDSNILMLCTVLYT